MNYNHQLYEDTSLRTKDRLSKFSKLPENELNNFEISITQQIERLNGVISSKDNSNQISVEINNLYELINEGVKISDGIFKNDLFIDNLYSLLLNPAFGIQTCKLLSRILYYTDQLGVILNEFMLPLFHLFLENISSQDVESIVNLLCNLSADLCHFIFEDDYYDKTLVHPLKTIARNIKQIEAATKVSNYEITYSYLLFIRHVANFSFPSDTIEFNGMVEYLKSLYVDPQVQGNNDFKLIILWTIYDINSIFFEYCINTLIKDEFIPFLVSQLKDEDYLFAEPILGIFYYITCNFKLLDEKPENPIFDFDLSTVYSLCLSAPTESIQYEAFQLIHIMTEIFPSYMYSQDVVQLLVQASEEDNCSYKMKYQILWIACILISRNDISFIPPDILHILLAFIVNNSIDNEERADLALQNIIFLRRTMQLEKRIDIYDQLAAESGVDDFIEELRDSTNEKICILLDQYDKLANGSEDFIDAFNYSCAENKFSPFDDGGLITQDDADMISDYKMLFDSDEQNSDNDDDDENFDDSDDDSHHIFPKINFTLGRQTV